MWTPDALSIWILRPTSALQIRLRVSVAPHFSLRLQRRVVRVLSRYWLYMNVRNKNIRKCSIGSEIYLLMHRKIHRIDVLVYVIELNSTQLHSLRYLITVQY